MEGGAHITSFVILCRPQLRRGVSAAVAALPGVEVHHCGADGKIVAVAEGDDAQAMGEALMRLQDLPGVAAANMVYHGVDAPQENGDGR